VPSPALSQQLYYRLKPHIPWRIRTALRRWRARHLRAASTDQWPILEAAGQKPANWPGWPEGKRFAFVLTHDVEGRKGLDRCEALASLENRLGFRSSFNFIPEGSYNVSAALRDKLRHDGFEVGVHDLRHDGFLYRSQAAFQNAAQHINRYLREWQAAGFRSGFMHHNLNWFDPLEIRYDASTFDTDPFEPQPDGVGTIFPFWVPTNNGSQGFAELPYTLVQDFNLFIILQEQTIDIWKQKLDWIAARGGMALLIVHPDYVNFSDGPNARDEFSVRLYEQFLEYVRTRYAGEYWHPLPRDVAAFVGQHRIPKAQETPAPIGLESSPTPKVNGSVVPARQKRICMITHSFYESDNRVLRYAETLAERGDLVNVVALRRNPTTPKEETLNGVQVFRIQDRFGKNEQSKLSFLLPVLRFLLASSWWLTRRHAREKYDVIHVHNIPDFLVFAAWFPKLTGARIILDIHDIVPEFFCSKFATGGRSALVWGLRTMEKWSAAFAHHVILANHLWLEKYTARSARSSKCSVFINNVDSRVFQPQARIRQDDRPIVLFPGGLQWHQGLDIAIRAFGRLQTHVPTAEFHIYGDGGMKTELIALTAELGLTEKVKFFAPLSVREIVRVMADADLGVVPKRADSFGNEAYSTKIMEFMAVGVPVVISRTKVDEFYFTNDVVRFFESNNVEALSDAMLELIRDTDQRKRLRQNATAYVEQHCWKTKRQDYLNLVDSLITRN
jgi:glycosyltransferase involved in cell wall biosynthesis